MAENEERPDGERQEAFYPLSGKALGLSIKRLVEIQGPIKKVTADTATAQSELDRAETLRIRRKIRGPQRSRRDVFVLAIKSSSWTFLVIFAGFTAILLSIYAFGFIFVLLKHGFDFTNLIELAIEEHSRRGWAGFWESLGMAIIVGSCFSIFVFLRVIITREEPF